MDRLNPLARLLGLDWRRRRLLRRTPPGPLRDQLSVPFPPPGRDCREVRFLAVDLETTGLDAAADEILSVGWVALEGGRIDLGTAGHRLVAATRAVAPTAPLHRITDDVAASGAPPAEVLTELLRLLAGRVLVAHNAAFELQFLDAACRRAFGGPLLVPAVDTLALAVGWLERRIPRERRPDLRLDAVRRRHNLPRYRAHDALADAVAAAELFLAQLAKRERAGGALPLRAVLLPQ